MYDTGKSRVPLKAKYQRNRTNIASSFFSPQDDDRDLDSLSPPKPPVKKNKKKNAKEENGVNDDGVPDKKGTKRKVRNRHGGERGVLKTTSD